MQGVEASEVSEAIAIVQGQVFTELPQDLYIPPDALEILLETFEGPLDLLLYLIKKQNIDILDIPIAEITGQFMEYVEIMKTLRLDLAAEYLVMAAMLAEIKSRVLLPRPNMDEDDEEDPRADLIRRLQEYECFKQAAETLNDLPRAGRDTFIVQAQQPEFQQEKVYPAVGLDDLMGAMRDLLLRADRFAHHQIQREVLSVRERMTQVLAHLPNDHFVDFVSLFKIEEGRMGVVVTFLAILELIKESLIDMVQAEPFSSIHVKLVDVSL